MPATRLEDEDVRARLWRCAEGLWRGYPRLSDLIPLDELVAAGRGAWERGARWDRVEWAIRDAIRSARKRVPERYHIEVPEPKLVEVSGFHDYSRDRRVLIARARGLTYEEIGKREGVSVEWARALCVRGEQRIEGARIAARRAAMRASRMGGAGMREARRSVEDVVLERGSDRVPIDRFVELVGAIERTARARPSTLPVRVTLELGIDASGPVLGVRVVALVESPGARGVPDWHASYGLDSVNLAGGWILSRVYRDAVTQLTSGAFDT